MEIVLGIVLAVVVLIALYYQHKCFKYEKVINNSINAMKKERLKNKATILLIRPIIENYRKNLTYTNACTSMAKISDILFDQSKKEISSKVESQS